MVSAGIAAKTKAVSGANSKQFDVAGKGADVFGGLLHVPVCTTMSGAMTDLSQTRWLPITFLDFSNVCLTLAGTLATVVFVSRPKP